MRTEAKNLIRELIDNKRVGTATWRPSMNDLRMMGIPRRRFGQILRNEQQPTLTELFAIAKFLDVNPKDLF